MEMWDLGNAVFVGIRVWARVDLGKGGLFIKLIVTNIEVIRGQKQKQKVTAANGVEKTRGI